MLPPLALALCALAQASPDAPPEVVYIAGDTRLTHTADFAIAASGFAPGGRYLSAVAGHPGDPPGAIRIPAPAGRYHAYLTWMRRPEGARDVLVRLPGLERRVDMSRLANGLSPEDLQRDDMPRYGGVCSSGLFRLTDQPLDLRPGDVVDVVRSDAEPGTVTSFCCVFFSPCLYLDDLGNDATLRGTATINLKDYGRALSGDVGPGVAFPMAGRMDASVEWTVPSDGLFLLSADPNRGSSRAPTMPLEVRFPDGWTASLTLAGASPAFGRSSWQGLGVLRDARGATITLRAAEGGAACCVSCA